MTEFLNMGGYAFYVWSSFGLVALVMLGNALWPGMAHRRLVAEIRMGLAAQEERQHASGS